MSTRNTGLVKTFTAGAAINPARLVKFGADDQTVLQGAAGSDLVFGVSDAPPLPAAATGERVDVVFTGIQPVTYGGTVTRGEKLMSDSSGRAITATASNGANVNTAGIAMVSGVVGDLGSIFLFPGSFQG
jgi:hypothetical protein